MLYRELVAFTALLAAVTIVPADGVALDTADGADRQKRLCSCHSMDKPLLVIDRFEGGFAVLEYGGEIINLPRLLLPAIAQEGDILCLSLAVDQEKTERRRQLIRALTEELYEP